MLYQTDLYKQFKIFQISIFDQRFRFLLGEDTNKIGSDIYSLCFTVMYDRARILMSLGTIKTEIKEA